MPQRHQDTKFHKGRYRQGNHPHFAAFGNSTLRSLREMKFTEHLSDKINLTQSKIVNLKSKII